MSVQEINPIQDFTDSIFSNSKKKKKPGCPCKLIIEDQVLMTLQYLREYRIQYHIGTDWGVTE